MGTMKDPEFLTVFPGGGVMADQQLQPDGEKAYIWVKQELFATQTFGWLWMPLFMDSPSLQDLHARPLKYIACDDRGRFWMLHENPYESGALEFFRRTNFCLIRLADWHYFSRTPDDCTSYGFRPILGTEQDRVKIPPADPPLARTPKELRESLKSYNIKIDI